MTDKEIETIYNRFDKKDMTLPEFKKQIKALTDPAGIQRDLAALQIRRKVGI